MTLDEMIELFESDEGYLDGPTRDIHPRRDVAAFLLLHELVPQTQDILGHASHDEVFLSVDPELLARVATPEDIAELRRCGVRYDSSTDSLCMFV